jgi:uncharacterized protein with PQ loop repeat
MQDIITNIIGYAATAAGISIMLPQVFKSFQTKKTGDLSMIMVVIFIINCSLWTTYGLLIAKAPVVLANVITLILVVMQLVLKLKYDMKKF